MTDNTRKFFINMGSSDLWADDEDSVMRRARSELAVSTAPVKVYKLWRVITRCKDINIYDGDRYLEDAEPPILLEE